MLTIRQNNTLLALILAMLLITSCASQDVTDLPAETYFNRAMQAIAENDVLLATEQLQLLNNQYPFSPYTAQALLELAHLEFLTGNHENVNAIIDRFLRLHAISDQVDYAYYLKAMTFFALGRSALQDYSSINPSLRDLSNSQVAYQNFEFLIRNYPNSRYAKDARDHMAYIRTLLAQKEVTIGEYYLQREAWVAAVNRSNYVLENFIDSRTSVALALDIMTFAYAKMEMTEQSQKAQKLLTSNFPDYKPKYTR